MRFRLTVLAIVLLSVQTAPVSASAAAPSDPGAAARRCSKGALTVSSGRRTVCIPASVMRRVPRSAQPEERLTARAQALLVLQRRTLTRLVGRRRAGEAMRLLAAGRATARAPRSARARAAHASPAAQLPQIAGWQTKSVLTPVAADPAGDATGGDARIDSTTTTVGPGPARRIRMTQTISSKQSWKCPDEAGNVAGRVSHKETVRLTAVNARTGRVEASRTRSFGYEGVLEAHVGDDARLIDYDLSVTGHAGGTRVSAAFTGLPPRQPWRIEAIGDSIRWGGSTGQDYNRFEIGDSSTRSVQMSERGGRAIEPAGEEALALLAVLSLAKSAADRTVKAAFEIWYAHAGCVTVAYAPPGAGATSLEVVKDEPTGLRLEARSRLDSKLIGGGGRHQFDLGPAAPSEFRLQAGSPGFLVITAQRKPSHSQEGVLTRGLSRRGRFQGSLRVTVKEHSFPSSYTGTVAGSAHRTDPGFDVNETWTASNLVFRRSPESAPGHPFYNLESGTVEWNASGTFYQCSVSGHHVFSLAKPANGTWGQISFEIDGERYRAFGSYPDTTKVTYTCPEGGSYEAAYPPPAWLDTFGPQGAEQRRAADFSLSGTLTTTESDHPATYNWSFAPQP